MSEERKESNKESEWRGKRDMTCSRRGESEKQQ